jgi:hypothetical protein
LNRRNLVINPKGQHEGVTLGACWEWHRKNGFPVHPSDGGGTVTMNRNLPVTGEN